MDLRPAEHRAAATALLLGLEEAAFLLADNISQEKTIRKAAPHIRQFLLQKFLWKSHFPTTNFPTIKIIIISLLSQT